MKTMLCLTDFSSTANHAADYGCFIAKDLEVELSPLENYEKVEAE